MLTCALLEQAQCCSVHACMALLTKYLQDAAMYSGCQSPINCVAGKALLAAAAGWLVSLRAAASAAATNVCALLESVLHMEAAGLS